MAEPSARAISRLLIANRGEIARRILRSAHAMGIGTVAVYADGDAEAPFVGEADQAVALDGRSSAETYLDIDKILAAAQRSGADAVHPGYGFLAESATFAQAVLDAGLIWVGPHPEALSAMGDKLAAKRLMQEVGVPTLEAVELAHEQDPGPSALQIGYPLLIKAAAGGGGKGMRVVFAPDELDAAVHGARREAEAAFGDSTVFVERWLAAARHVEIQLLGDLHGNLVHCFERECSIQRRHQKIIEEAPSPAVSEELRTRLGAAALSAGRAIGYTSAGTVEFLVDGDELWFLEVNARLQVEHPVTEEITGLDLVREQLRIAQGETLGLTQDQLSFEGHAIEVRLYAEDPANDFLPVTGRVAAFEPSTRAAARFESGIESGSEVGIEFDPLLAKVIVHAPTRSEAASRLARVLETSRVQGLVTNRDFLVAVLRSPEFLAGDTATDFVDRVEVARRGELAAEVLQEAALLAALAAQVDRRREATVLATVPSGWRNTVMPPEEVVYRVAGARATEGEEIHIQYRIRRDGTFGVRTGEAEHTVEIVSRQGDEICAVLDGRRICAAIAGDGDRRFVHGPWGDVGLIELPRFPSAGAEALAGGLVAPMPGKVISVRAKVGDEVEAGDLLVVLEAMKMEHRLTAPARGRVEELRVAEGDQVKSGELLAVVAEEAAAEEATE